MKIVFVYDAIFPYVLGGAERHVYEVAVRLGKQHDVHLVGMKCWDGPDVVELAQGVYAHGICSVPPEAIQGQCFTRTLTQVLRYSMCLPSALKRLTPIDVIDCVSIPYFPIFFAKYASYRLNVPFTSVWLESWSRDVWRTYMGPVKGLVGSLVERFSTLFPQHFLPISEHTRRGLLAMGVADEKMTVITPGIDWNEIQEAPLEQRACDIIFVGRLIKDKGVDKLLEALPAVRRHKPDIRCRIVGDGPERRALESLCDSLGVRENVEFTGSVDSVYPFLKSAKMLVHPSRREGFGITLIEAAACGIPVITVAEPGNASRELVERGNIGIVCKLEAGPLAESILSLMDSADVRDEYGARARTWSQQYDWNNIAHAFESAYCQFLNEKKNMQAA